MDEFYDEEPEFFEGYSSDEESIEPQEEMEGMAEYGWQERASFNHPLLRNIEDRNITEQERYGINVNTYINKYKDRFVFNTKRLLDVILEDYEMVKYKNPIAYILSSYVVYNRDIDRERFKKVADFIESNKEVGDTISPPDIIRYARFWIKL